MWNAGVSDSRVSKSRWRTTVVARSPVSQTIEPDDGTDGTDQTTRAMQETPNTELIARLLESRLVIRTQPFLCRFSLTCAAAAAIAACGSAEEPPAPPGSTASPGGPVLGEMPVTTPGDVINEVDTPRSGPGGPVAVNLGSETLCDGLDENNNGIIDDVDVGKDGLCDCIRLGFFGQVSSDAGDDTAAFQAWLAERSGQVPVKNLGASETLTAEWLADLQVLIIGGMQERVIARGTGATFSADEIAAFDQWLQTSGGGVFTLAGYTESAGDVMPTNELLANLGMQYTTASVPAAGVIGDGAPPIWLSGIAAPTHPSVENVTEFGFYYGYPVSGDGTVILQGQGYDLAMAKEVGNGRAFVFGDEWITQDITWSGSVKDGNDPCQQPCNEQANICPIAASQCADCAKQACSDPNDTDPDTCFKGCQPSCESETMRCEMYTADCEACSADTDARAQATPRFWLNTIRWLTPQNECQVEIPVTIRVR